MYLHFLTHFDQELLGLKEVISEVTQYVVSLASISQRPEFCLVVLYGLLVLGVLFFQGLQSPLVAFYFDEVCSLPLGQLFYGVLRRGVPATALLVGKVLPLFLGLSQKPVSLGKALIEYRHKSLEDEIKQVRPDEGAVLVVSLPEARRLLVTHFCGSLLEACGGGLLKRGTVSQVFAHKWNLLALGLARVFLVLDQAVGLILAEEEQEVLADVDQRAHHGSVVLVVQQHSVTL